jgi:VCBS repeat-containing protein
MDMAATASVSKVSFNNTPQASNDYITQDLHGRVIDEDSTGYYILDVMANDAGGKGKTLYSIDNLSTGSGTINDLLQKDTIGSWEQTQWGEATITSSGAVLYHLSDAGRAHFQYLNAGQTDTDTFNYAIQMGNGTLSWATATVVIAGMDDGRLKNGGFEDGGQWYGNLRGWEALGNVTLIQRSTNSAGQVTYFPSEGIYATQIKSQGYNLSQVSEFLHVDETKVTTFLDDGASFDSASAIKSSQFTVKEGETIKFDWALQDLNRDIGNNFALVSFGDGNLIKFADSDVLAENNTTFTGWQTYSYTAPSDMVVVIGFAYCADYVGHRSELWIDNIRVV